MGTTDSNNNNVNRDSTDTARPTFTPELEEKIRPRLVSKLTDSSSDREKGALGKGRN